MNIMAERTQYNEDKTTRRQRKMKTAFVNEAM